MLLSCMLVYPIATEKGRLRAGDGVVARTENKKEQASFDSPYKRMQSPRRKPSVNSLQSLRQNKHRRMAFSFVLMVGCVFWAKCAPGNNEFQVPWHMEPPSEIAVKG